MFHYLLNDVRLYRRLVILQIRAQAQYKLNLLLDFSTYLSVTVLEFIAALLFFVPFPTLLGWRIGEVALLVSIMSIGFGLAEMVGSGIDDFASTIRHGDFDRLLLRPIGVLTQVTGSDFRLRRLGRITEGTVAFLLAMHFLPDFHWTLDKILLIPIAVISGAVIFISMLLLGATICFWTVETTELTNILTYGSREMLSYPLTIYSQVLQCLFLFVVPVAFGSYIPVCYLLDRSLPFGLPGALAFAAPGVALLFALVASGMWRFGVRHYQSTGS